MARTHFSGPLVIGDEVAGTEYAVLADASENEVLSSKPVASAVNNIGLRNAATGNNPIIYNAGEADTGITLSGSDGTNYEEILVLDANATAVNEVTIDNAATSSNPSIAATGDDTNISLQLTAKATGIVIVGNSSTGSAVTGTATIVNAQRGYITEQFTMAGTSATQVVALSNNKITADSHIFCSVENPSGNLTAGILVVSAVRQAASSASIYVSNIDDTTAVGTARVHFFIA